VAGDDVRIFFAIGDDIVIEEVGGMAVAKGDAATPIMPCGVLAARSNATGLSFSVLGANMLCLPATNWPVLGHAVESPATSGKYQFTNSPATNPPQFFILRQP